MHELTIRELTLEEVSEVSGGFDWVMFAVEAVIVVGTASIAIPASVPIGIGVLGVSAAYLAGYAVGMGINYAMGYYDNGC